MSDLTLYNYFRSSTSFRARIALHHKNLDFKYVPVHLLKKEQHSPEYRKISPLGEVPTLVHGGRAIAQSLAILEYLDEAFPSTPRLYPADLLARAQVRQFCENINSFIHPMGNLKVLQRLEALHGYDQDAKDAWVSYWTQQGFEALERTLEVHAGDYSFGNTVTAADVCLIPAVITAARFKTPLDAFPIARRIFDSCLKLPAFEKAHPGRQVDTPDEFRV